MNLGYTIWPNGEASVWRQRRFKTTTGKKRTKYAKARAEGRVRLCYGENRLPPMALRALGLSTLHNFSLLYLKILIHAPELALGDFEAVLESEEKRHGLNGITSKGCKVVRNCCHLLETTVRRQHLSFVTLTLPSIEVSACQEICKFWHIAVDSYVRGLRRRLEKHGACPQVVYCSEIQTERYKSADFPPLHLHLVFVGRRRGFRGWAVSPAQNDKLWRAALNAALKESARCKCIDTPVQVDKSKMASACRIEQVRESASRYLGKYLSKGLGAVDICAKKGHTQYLPRQWWGCSRVMRRQIELAKLSGTASYDQILAWGEYSSTGHAWRWVKHIFVGDEQDLWVGSVGWLHTDVHQKIRQIHACNRGKKMYSGRLVLCGTLPRKALYLGERL